MLKERSGMNDDPLIFALELTRNDNVKIQRYLDTVMNTFSVYNENQSMIRQIMDATGTRFMTYVKMNPELSMHTIYARSYTGIYIPEHYRVAFSRMRTSSHRLRIETGRWARIPREQRYCPCGKGVQDEQHVLTGCDLTEHLRIAYPGVLRTNLSDVSSECEFKYVHDVLKCTE